MLVGGIVEGKVLDRFVGAAGANQRPPELVMGARKQIAPPLDSAVAETKALRVTETLAARLPPPPPRAAGS